MTIAIVATTTLPISSFGQGSAKGTNFSKPESLAFSGPENLYECVKRRNDKELYTLSDKLNPFYLRLDLDGDGKLDFAVLIERARDKKLGMLVCWANKRSEIVFAGTQVEFFGTESSDDLAEAGMDYWWVYSGKIRKLEELPAPPPKAGEAIFFGKSEAWGGTLYWTGKKFVVYMGE
ncbi:hypothetical protein [Noviherbaspirillum massiliense]|uniref:hypothetical protein n=1 Tax=Noviherbaspirillum massiliense TaxID=1465823 RepID=UPI0011DCAA34|nr:hypothetical protein [Noviherbaspirillum massiliense]